MIDWSLTSLNALIVTDWEEIDWEGVPEISPVEEWRFNPVGSDPDETMNEISSPSTDGAIKKRLFFVRTYDDWEYENDETDWRMVNMRTTDWELTWLNALIVTDWDDNDWEGDPEMIPFVELSDNPIGRDPDVIENDRSSPLIEGVTENELFFAKTKEDWVYENEEIDWRIVNERENDWSLTWLNALIVTDCNRTNWEGLPDMNPVEESRLSPVGSNPDMIVNDRSSPLIEGGIEHDSPVDRMNEDWG